MNKALPICCTQSLRNLNAGLKHLINRPHSTKAMCIKQYEMIERSFYSHFFTTPGTGHSGQWFRVGCIDRRAAGRACLCHRVLPSTAIETDCNIQRLQSNEMAARSEERRVGKERRYGWQRTMYKK